MYIYAGAMQEVYDVYNGGSNDEYKLGDKVYGTWKGAGRNPA